MMSFIRYPDYINHHVSLPTRLFICCDSDSLVLGTHLNMSNENSTEELLRELVATVNTLKKDIDELKAKDAGRTYPQKRQRDGDDEGNDDESHDGDSDDSRDGDHSDSGEMENDGSRSSRFILSEGGEAFLETTFNSRLEYKDRKRHIAKYGEPESKWTTCPSISPVVAATLPPVAIREDKTAFRSQQMYMEAVAPLAALLENTDDDKFTIKEAIPMVQSAIRLLGDATQHQSSMRRKAIMQHLNPQLQTLMKDVDFKGTQPLLFGEDFGEKAKARMDAAAALQKIVTPAGPKGKQTGFQKGHSQRSTWGRQGGKTKGSNFKPKKFQGSKGSQGQGKS